jgi:hypothetical protein
LQQILGVLLRLADKVAASLGRAWRVFHPK